MDYIDEALQEGRLRFGRELTPQELAEKFIGHDLETRVFHLKTLSSPDEMTIDQGVRRMEYESALRGVHDVGRKVNR